MVLAVLVTPADCLAAYWTDDRELFVPGAISFGASSGSWVMVRQAMDLTPPRLYQAVLTDFIREGHFARHIRKLRLVYGERRTALVDSIRKEFESSLEVHGSDAAMHLAITLPKGFRDQEVPARAAREKLWLWPLSPAYTGKTARQRFILGFGGAKASEMPNAVRQLKKVLMADTSLT
jgi:GntR family transcriptional regulator/MocR family aminotransferase